jgi:hypothetical protein
MFVTYLRCIHIEDRAHGHVADSTGFLSIRVVAYTVDLACARVWLVAMRSVRGTHLSLTNTYLGSCFGHICQAVTTCVELQYPRQPPHPC